MKKLNKKGFTIVELVIVIAVIAILAAVLIPTFANVSEKANESAAMQAAKNEYTNYLADNEQNITGGDFIIVSGEYVFVVEDGSFLVDGTKFAKASGATTYTAKVTTQNTASVEWTLTKGEALTSTTYTVKDVKTITYGTGTDHYEYSTNPSSVTIYAITYVAPPTQAGGSTGGN